MFSRLHLPRSFLLVVMRHLQSRPLEAALDVESLVRLGAVQNSLVATNVLRHIVQSLDDPQTKLLALLVLCDRDVLDVAYKTEAVNAAEQKMSARSPSPSILRAAKQQECAANLQLPLYQQRSRSHHFALPVENDQYMRADCAVTGLLHVVEAGFEVGL